jgi:predicted DNA-binding transcriptional regulator
MATSRTPTSGTKAAKQPPKPTQTATKMLSSAKASTDQAGSKWTFLTNHAHVLILLAQDSSMVLREVAIRIGITERAVQRIIADLEEGGFIEREKVGRQNQYRISAKQPLRHPIESHRTIGDLLQMITKR